MSNHGMATEMATGLVTRTYGEGSVYQRASDWRWIATFQAGFTPSGGRRRVTVSALGCEGGCPQRCSHRGLIKRKARDKRAVLLAERGNVVSKRTTSVGKWAPRWLEAIQPHVRPSAYNTDAAAVRWIVDAIGGVKLSDLQPEHVYKVAAKIRAGKLSTSTALRYHGSLMRMLKAAALEGYAVPTNVMLATAPKEAVHDRAAVPTADCVTILSQIATEPRHSRWVLALLQGLRQAEALGLTWSQVDLDARTITISWQAQALAYLDRDNPDAGFRVPDGYETRHLVGAWHLVRPKSKAGWRVIPLTPWAAAALARWQEVAPDNPHGLVWPGRTTSKGVWPRNPASDRDEWHAIQKAAGVAHPSGRRYHVHEIRHSTATLLLEAQVPETVRIAIMGHSRITTTRGYEHVDLTQQRAALAKIGERLALD